MLPVDYGPQSDPHDDPPSPLSPMGSPRPTPAMSSARNREVIGPVPSVAEPATPLEQAA